jgi:hypothetical protein
MLSSGAGRIPGCLDDASSPIHPHILLKPPFNFASYPRFLHQFHHRSKVVEQMQPGVFVKTVDEGLQLDLAITTIA